MTQISLPQAGALPGFAADEISVIFNRLNDAYPNADCTLQYESNYQLLIGAILLAKSTEEEVNRLMPRIFGRFPDVFALVEGKRHEIEALLRPLGFYRQKARHIQQTAQFLIQKYDGVVPTDLLSLTKLPGVSRKTAHLILGEVTGRPKGIMVDTHVRRISKRLGLADGKSSEAVEGGLMEIVPQDQWHKLPYLFISHGRRTCHVSQPRCADCPLKKMCPSATTFTEA